MRIHLCFGFVIVLSAGASTTFAQPGASEGERRTVTAVRLDDNERLVLDGLFDEAVWARAIPATDFVQQDPVNGAAPTERTEVRFAVSREALYMAVTCFDSEPDRLAGNTMKRDEFLRADDRFMWVYLVYTHNWLDDPSLSRFATLDRRAATKILYTIGL